MNRLGYQPALDGLRAVAIAGVVAYHAFAFPAGGWLGVDLFFALSGFLITTLLFEEHAEQGRVSLVGFYRRRAYRLLPALFAMLAIYLVVSLAFAVRPEESAANHVAGAFVGVAYVANLVQAGGLDTPDALDHLWSLAAEEQFYLVWPLLLFGVLKARTRLALILVSAGIAFTTLRALDLALSGEGWQRLSFGPDTRSASILVGCLLALVLASGRSLPAALFPLALVVFFWGVLVLPVDSVALSGPPLLLFALACGLLIARALDRDSVFAHALSVPPMLFLASRMPSISGHPVSHLARRVGCRGGTPGRRRHSAHRARRDRVLLPRRAAVPAA